MTKLVLVLWDERRRDRPGRRVALVDELGPALLRAGVARLGVDVADEHARAPSPSPFPLGAERPCGLVNAWVDDPSLAATVVALAREAGFRVAAYRVEASVPTDYGDNAHARRRDWPDGQRSPGILTVNLLERPAGLDRETWVRRWHEGISVVSARLQPRTRYVRNLVLEALTPDAPPWEGIVEEGWPGPETLRSAKAFYGATSLPQLVAHQLAILRAVASFVRPWRVTSVPMSEYLLRS